MPLIPLAVLAGVIPIAVLAVGGGLALVGVVLASIKAPKTRPVRGRPHKRTEVRLCALGEMTDDF